MTKQPKQDPILDILKSSKSNKSLFIKIHNFKAFNKIPYDSLNYKEDLIRITCERTNDNLIKYTKYNVFFCHPIHKNFACDIFGSVYDISQVDQPQLMIYHDTIFISCEHDSVLKYDFLKFKEECLKIYPSDKLNDDFQSCKDNEEIERRNKEYKLKKQMKMMEKIRNSSKSTNNSQDESSDDETDDESNN